MHSQVISLSVQKQTLGKGREIVAEDRDLPSLFEVLSVRVLGQAPGYGGEYQRVVN